MNMMKKTMLYLHQRTTENLMNYLSDNEEDEDILMPTDQPKVIPNKKNA